MDRLASEMAPTEKDEEFSPGIGGRRMTQKFNDARGVVPIQYCPHTLTVSPGLRGGRWSAGARDQAAARESLRKDRRRDPGRHHRISTKALRLL